MTRRKAVALCYPARFLSLIAGVGIAVSLAEQERSPLILRSTPRPTEYPMPIAKGVDVTTWAQVVFTPICHDADGKHLSARRCLYKHAVQPFLRAKQLFLLRSADLDVRWDRVRKAWVVEPKGGKVLWGPVLSTTAQVRGGPGGE